MKKIVVIGGGTGTYAVLSGLKDYYLDLTAIVTMSDDGGSTGRLRDEYGVLPPGDLRRCLVALSTSDKVLRDLFEYRFKKGSLDGHSFGNLFLTALKEVLGSDESAIEEASKILKINGRVLPVTLDDVRLFAELDDGTLIQGETNIDIPKHNTNKKIKKVFLKPEATANENAIKRILDADLIVIGPGDLFTSIIPNLLVKGISEAIKKSKAKKIYISNLMTKNGETNDFRVTDFATEIERYLGKDVLDVVLFGKEKFEKKVLREYEKEKAYPVKIDYENFKNFKTKFLEKEFYSEGELIRHDKIMLAAAIIEELTL